MTPGDAPNSPRDPDARFILANERTLLAWMRTALAVLIAGTGLLHFLPGVPLTGLVGLGLLVLGAACFPIGLQRYRATDAAMRRNRLPPKGVSLEVISLVLFGLATTLIVLLVVHHQITG